MSEGDFKFFMGRANNVTSLFASKTNSRSWVTFIGRLRETKTKTSNEAASFFIGRFIVSADDGAGHFLVRCLYD
jgi:hypothetical protein